MSIINVVPFPRVVRIEPASACNLRCIHCPTGTVDMPRGIMRSEIFDLIVENIEKHLDKVKVVVLYHGGEPLLNSKLPDMIRELKSIGIPFIKTVSNGMMLNTEIGERLIEAGLDSIEFSLDGESPEDNNSIRRNSDYQKILGNIKSFIDLKNEKKSELPSVAISMTQFLRHSLKSPKLQAEIPVFIKQDLGEAYLSQLNMNAVLAMQWPGLELSGRFDLYVEDEKNDANYCDHVINTVTVRWNGDVVPCCYDLTTMLLMGNILESDIADIWNNASYRELRNSISQRRFKPLCEHCNVVRPPGFLIRRNNAYGTSAE